MASPTDALPSSPRASESANALPSSPRSSEQAIATKRERFAWATATWREDPQPSGWRVYRALLVVAALPFAVRGVSALLEEDASQSVLASLLVTLLPAHFCIVQLPPYRFLHLTTGFLMLGAFFAVGPAVLGLLCVSVAAAELTVLVARTLFPNRGKRPLGGLAAEYATPLASLTLLLGMLDLSRGSLGLSYPFRPTTSQQELRFLLLVLGIWLGFIALSELSTFLRFGFRRVMSTPNAKSDMALYLLVSVIGYPVIADIALKLGNEETSTIRAQLSMLWAFASFAVVATLVRRRIEVERLGRRVAIQERLAALGRLASVVAHQTRHLLGVLNMSAYVLDETLTREPLSSSARATLERELTAMAETREELDRLLARELRADFSEEPFGLLELASKCAAQLAPLARERKISVEIAGSAREGLGDPLRLKQAIANVLRNAIEAAPEGSRVSVDCAATATELLLSVRDRGRGLSTEARQRLFEPLFTDKPGGLGMGLFVARAVVEAHGGTVSIEDVSDGTEARIVIPRAI